MDIKELKKIKIPCARCDKEKSFPFLFCQNCYDGIIKYTKQRVKKEVFEDIEKLELDINDGSLSGRFTDTHGYKRLKKLHLSTSKKEGIELSFKSTTLI